MAISCTAFPEDRGWGAFGRSGAREGLGALGTEGAWGLVGAQGLGAAWRHSGGWVRSGTFGPRELRGLGGSGLYGGLVG